MKLLDVLQKDLTEAAAQPLKEQRHSGVTPEVPGLSSKEAQRLLIRDGPNQLDGSKKANAFKILLSQLKTFWIYFINQYSNSPAWRIYRGSRPLQSSLF